MYIDFWLVNQYKFIQVSLEKRQCRDCNDANFQTTFCNNSHCPTFFHPCRQFIFFKPSDNPPLRNRGYMARQLTVFTDRSAAAENLVRYYPLRWSDGFQLRGAVFILSFSSKRNRFQPGGDADPQITYNLHRQPKGHDNYSGVRI